MSAHPTSLAGPIVWLLASSVAWPIAIAHAEPPASQSANGEFPAELLSMPRTAPPSSAPAQVVSFSCDEVPRLLLARNYQVIGAQLAVKGAEADLLQTRLYPTNPNLTYSISNIALDSRSATAGQGPGLGPYDLPSAAPWIQNITLSQTIALWGKRSSAIDAARYGIGVFGAKLDDLIRALRAQAVQQCFATLELSLQVDAQRTNVESFDVIRLKNRERYRAGAISYGDFEKIELEYQGEALALQQTELLAVQAMLAFKQLLAVPAGVDLRIDDTLDPAAFVDETQDYVALALDKRPDVKAAGLALDQDEASYRLAIAQGRPDLTVGLGYTYDRNYSDFPSALNLSLGMDLPIFNRNQGGVQRADVQIRSDRAILDQTKAQVAIDVKTALAQYEIAKEALLVYRQGLPGTALGALPQARQVLGIATRQQEAGAASFVDLVFAQRDYNQEVISYLQAEAALVESVAQLEGAVGSSQIPLVPVTAITPSSEASLFNPAAVEPTSQPASRPASRPTRPLAVPPTPPLPPGQLPTPYNAQPPPLPPPPTEAPRPASPPAPSTPSPIPTPHAAPLPIRP